MPQEKQIGASGGFQTIDEAQQKAKRWGILVYGDPGRGKTHFAYTMPEPIYIIDTENKAHEIASKFSDKDIQIATAANYDEAKEALDYAIRQLEKEKNRSGQIGTIVVDSMSDMWEYAKQKHLEMKHPNKEPHEVNLKSALSAASDPDWPAIKRYHNKRFREVMAESEFHFCWTAQQKEDYQTQMNKTKRDNAPLIPEGRSDNDHKASEVLHLTEDNEGNTVGNLRKSSLTKAKFGGLTYPEFSDVQEIVEYLEENVDGQGVLPSEAEAKIEEKLGHEVDIMAGDPDLVYLEQEMEDDNE